MQTDAPVSKKMLWTGRIVSTLPVLMLLMSSSMKLMKNPQALEGLVKYGYPENALLFIDLAELTCTILYVIPKTSVLGAILLTGYLGGAVDTHVRAGELFITPIIVGMAVWAGLYIRDTRIRGLIPLRSNPE